MAWKWLGASEICLEVLHRWQPSCSLSLTVPIPVDAEGVSEDEKALDLGAHEVLPLLACLLKSRDLLLLPLGLPRGGLQLLDLLLQVGNLLVLCCYLLQLLPVVVLRIFSLHFFSLP